MAPPRRAPAVYPFLPTDLRLDAMNPQLSYMIAQERIADLTRISAGRGVANEVHAGGQPNPSRPRNSRPWGDARSVELAFADGVADGRGRWRCWMAAAAILVGAGWGSNQFTPMLLVYRHALGLGAGSLEAMFGIYAVGLIPGLFLAGPFSDARGRRLPVLGAATASLVGSLLLIAGAGFPALLYVGRFVVGLGSGAAFSAGTAWLRELSLLQPGNADSAQAARRAAVAMTTGFALGPLVSGLLAQWGPASRVLPYLPHVAFMVATLFASARLAPETITRRTRLSLSAGLPAGQARRRFRRSVAVIAPWVFAAPAVAFAFLPAAIGADRLTGGVAVTGAVTALTALAGVLIQPAARALDALQWRWSSGMIGLLICAAGLVLGADAIQVGSLWLLAPCAAVLGCAYGLCLVSGLIEVGRLARPEAVGSLTAVYYALAYLGLTAPYLLTLAAPLAGPGTLLLIAAAVALASAAAVAGASRPSADTAFGDSPPDAPCDSSGALERDRTGIHRPEQQRA
jgi:MFS family permease